MSRPSFISAAGSILFRLQLGFLVPFAGLSLLWTFWLFTKVSHTVIPNSRFLKFINSIWLISGLDDLLFAAVVLTIYVIVLVLIYNLSVLISWFIAGAWPKIMAARRRRRAVAALSPTRPVQEGTAGELFSGIDNIGIVLAGGGAKGAFQAGSMKAIYRFLAEHNALDKVKVISGTSIGSWNALFWLADLIKPSKGWDGRSVHEGWWRSIRLTSLIAPSWYFPTRKNSFLTTAPWQREFDDLFGQEAIGRHIADTKIRFYLTRVHVESGKLECTTNSPDFVRLPKVDYKVLRYLGTEQPSDLADEDAPETLDGADVDTFLKGIKFAVFASMDLPPLFPYMQSEGHYYEDGGVIDNLPIMFAAMEKCDLIFVLPLNSDFSAEPDHRSLLNRFLRVMDVRQGALERLGLKSVYLYNEIAALRDYANSLKSEHDISSARMPETLARALKRTHREARIFAVCPLRTFVESKIDTQQLWRNNEAGFAFRMMYDKTLNLLETKFDPKQEIIRVALVDSAGNITWDEDF